MKNIGFDNYKVWIGCKVNSSMEKK